MATENTYEKKLYSLKQESETTKRMLQAENKELQLELDSLKQMHQSYVDLYANILAKKDESHTRQISELATDLAKDKEDALRVLDTEKKGLEASVEKEKLKLAHERQLLFVDLNTARHQNEELRAQLVAKEKEHEEFLRESALRQSDHHTKQEELRRVDEKRLRESSAARAKLKVLEDRYEENLEKMKMDFEDQIASREKSLQEGFDVKLEGERRRHEEEFLGLEKEFAQRLAEQKLEEEERMGGVLKEKQELLEDKFDRQKASIQAECDSEIYRKLKAFEEERMFAHSKFEADLANAHKTNSEEAELWQKKVGEMGEMLGLLHERFLSVVKQQDAGWREGYKKVVHGDLFKYRKDGGRGPGPPNGRNCDARGHASSGLGGGENDDHVCDLLQDPDEEEAAFGEPPCSRSSGGEAGLTTVRAQKSTTTTWLVPMIANFLPARGFSREQAATLDIGDVVSVDASKEETRCPAYASLCDRVSFLVFPYFWQGSALDASQRLRFCVKQGLERAVHGFAEASSSPRSGSSPSPSAETAGGCKENGDGNSSSAIERDGAPAAPPSVPIRRHTVIFQHLALGLYGYEPKNSARILLEESFEALLQLDAPAFRPNQIEAIKIVEQDLQTARVLAYELRQLKALHSPNLRPRTAHSFYQNLFRKLIALPDQPGQYLRQHRVTFQKKHGIIRNRRHHYLVNMRPLLWRAQKVNLPPPLLVESGSGLPCEKQLRARPHYEQGVTHCLFPKPKTGFHALRRSQTTNEWIGLNRQYRIRDDVHTSREDDQVLSSSTASRCDCWRGLRLRDNLENVFALARGYDLSFAELRSGSAAYPYTHAHALHLRGQQQAVSATYRQFQAAATFLDHDLENVCEFWFDRSNAVFWALQYFSLLYEEDEEQYFSTARTGRTGLQLYKCAPGEALLSILCWERLRSVKVLGGGGGATRSDLGADRQPQSVSKLLASVLAKTAAGIATGGRSEDDEERSQSNEQSRQTHEGQGPAEWQTAVAPSSAWQMEIVLYQYFAAWSACWVPGAGREGSSETSTSVENTAAATSSWRKNLPRMDEMLQFYDDYMRTTTRQIHDHAQLRRNYRGGEAEGAGRQAGVEPFFLSASAAAVESLGLCGYGSVVSVDDGREQENSTETFSSSGCALVAAFTSRTQDNQVASQRHCQQKLLDFHYYGSEDLQGKLELQDDAPPSQPPERPHDRPPETLLYHRGDCFLLRCSSRDRLVKSFRPTFLSAAQRKEMQFDVRTRQWTFLPRRANNYTLVPAAASSDSDHLGEEAASNPILLKLRVKPSSRFFVFSKLCGTAAWIADYAQLAWEAKLEEAATARDPTRHQHRFRQDWAFSLRGEREAIAAAGARELGSDEHDDLVLDSGSGRAQVHPIYSLFGAEVKHGWHWNLKMQLSGTASERPSRKGDQNHGSDSSSFCRRGRMTATTGEREFFGTVERPAPLQFTVDNEISGADLELELSLQQTGARKAELLAAVEVRCHAFIVWPNEADLLAELVEAVLPYCDGNASVIVAGGDDSNSKVEETIRTLVADVLALKNARKGKGTRMETEADPTFGAAVNIFDLVKVFSSGDPPRPNASSAVHNHMSIQPDEWFPGKPKGNTDRNLLQKMHLGMVAVADSIARERGAAWSAEKPVWHCFIESDTYFIPENFKRFLFSRRYVDVEAGAAGAASGTSSIGGERETNKSAPGIRSSTFTTRPRRWVGLTHNHRVHSEGYLFEPLQSGCFSEDALLDYATFLREREATRREGEEAEAYAKANADPPQHVAGQADDERRISMSGRDFPGENKVVEKKLTTITVEKNDNDNEKQIVSTDAQSSVLVGLAFCWEHLLAESARLDFAAMDVARNALFWAFLWSCGLAWGETGGPLSLQAGLRITSAALGIGVRQTGGDASEVVEKAHMYSTAGHGQRKRVVEKIEACWVKLAVDTRAELALAPATLARYLAAHCFDG
eukprot:g12080.t1